MDSDNIFTYVIIFQFFLQQIYKYFGIFLALRCTRI